MPWRIWWLSSIRRRGAGLCSGRFTVPPLVKGNRLADEACDIRCAGRWFWWVSLGRGRGGAEVGGGGGRVGGLGWGQVGERRGGVARGGGGCEGRPGENGDGGVEGVVAQRPPVAVAGVEAGRLPGPVGQHVGEERRRHRRRVPGRVGQPGQAGGGAGGAADPPRAGVPVGGRRRRGRGGQLPVRVGGGGG